MAGATAKTGGVAAPVAPAARPPSERSLSLDDKALDLIATDFRKIYDVYLFRLHERANTAQLFIGIFSAPYLVISALGITKVIDLTKDWSTLVSQIPGVMFLLFSICGFLGIIPYHRFWSAHCQQYKMIRYLNNFRRLYYAYFKREFDELGWAPRMESDPDFPVPHFLKMHWASISTAIMAMANICYVTFGLWLFDRNNITAPILGFLLSLIFHVMIFRNEIKMPDLASAASGDNEL